MGEYLALAYHLADAHLDGPKDAGLQRGHHQVRQGGDQAPLGDDELVDLGEGRPDHGGNHQGEEGVEGQAPGARGAAVLDGLGGGEEFA